MVLDGEAPQGRDGETLHRPVVQVDVGDPGPVPEGPGIHGIIVVLACDLDPAGGQVGNRLVAAVMAEFQFEGIPAQRQPHDLVSEADPEHRDLAQKSADRFHGVRNRLRVSRPVGEEDPIRLYLQNPIRAGRRGDERDVETVGHQHPQDVLLDPEIDRDDFRDLPEPSAVPGCRQVPFLQVPVARLPVRLAVRRDLPDEVAPDDRRELLRLPRKAGFIQVDRGDNPHLGALVPEAPGQRPGVHPSDPADVIPAQVAVEGLHVPPVRCESPRLPDDEPFHPGTGRLDVVRVDPGVPDLGVGHRDDLPLVGRVGEHLLVPGHPGVEDHLARALPFVSEGCAAEYRPVGQRQDRFPLRHRPLPPQGGSG